MGLKVLSALDTAKTQYYHFKAIIIAGMGLFSDAYDLFCIPPVTILLGHVYYHDQTPKFHIPAAVISAMVAVALLGTALGQLVFGILGDRIGRRKVYGLALALMVLSSFGCGFSICKSKTCVLLSLAFFRFLLGVGIGGDYPLSATIMSEFANKKTRGAFIAAVFSMQGFGILFSSMVIMTVCAIFIQATNASKDHKSHALAVDLAWRIILMLWCHPCCHNFLLAYTALVKHNVVQAAKDMEKVLDVQMNQIVDEATPPPSSSSNLPPLIRFSRSNFFTFTATISSPVLPHGFMFLYGFVFFFSNFGPNTTTFIVPAELFPARFRATCHGFSGAAGKVGAIIGSVAFLWVEDKEKDYKCTGKTGLTYFFTPETKGRSLEENEIENSLNEINEANELVRPRDESGAQIHAPDQVLLPA
uniref:Major facilitator superfamily (MFS) profile domain-containing protein n=1 Tax=Chenopodium quinoa TaxID=63459 RepID=A0A803M6M6_CHEQI